MDQAELLSLIPALAALVSGSLAIYSWRQTSTPGARAFALFALCVFIWCFLAVFEYLSANEATRIFFAKAEYLGIAFLPVPWLIFTLRYTHNDSWLRRVHYALLLVVPLLTVAFAWTDRWHGLVWKNVSLVEGSIVSLVIDYGPWFTLIVIPFTYLLFLIGIVVLLNAFFADSGLYRKQIAILLGAAFVPYLSNAFYLLANVTPAGVDPTPIGFAASSVGVAWALFGIDPFKSTPISYRTVFLSTSDSVILIDPNDRIVDVNPAALELLGVEHGAVVGEHLDAVHPQVLAHTDSSPTRAPEPLELSLDGGDVHLEVTIDPLRSAPGLTVGRAIIMRDVTYERNQQAELERFAFYDSLTGLANRRRFKLEAERIVARAAHDNHPLALLYIDLNGFKLINDRFGHRVGDEVLRCVSRRLEHSVRPGDLVARLGGDEFVALLPKADATQIAEIRDRLIANVEAPIEVTLPREAARPGASAEVRSSVGLSIGVARFPLDGTDLSSLLHRADADMYRSKQAGGLDFDDP